MRTIAELHPSDTVLCDRHEIHSLVRTAILKSTHLLPGRRIHSDLYANDRSSCSRYRPRRRELWGLQSQRPTLHAIAGKSSRMVSLPQATKRLQRARQPSKKTHTHLPCCPAQLLIKRNVSRYTCFTQCCGNPAFANQYLPTAGARNELRRFQSPLSSGSSEETSCTPTDTALKYWVQSVAMPL